MTDATPSLAMLKYTCTRESPNSAGEANAIQLAPYAAFWKSSIWRIQLVGSIWVKPGPPYFSSLAKSLKVCHFERFDRETRGDRKALIRHDSLLRR